MTTRPPTRRACLGHASVLAALAPASIGCHATSPAPATRPEDLLALSRGEGEAMLRVAADEFVALKMPLHLALARRWLAVSVR
jgi:hypothetical protein